MKEELIPTFEVLIKLGNIVIHTQEMLSSKGHQYDLVVLKQLIEDKEVNEWLNKMDKFALLPKKR